MKKEEVREKEIKVENTKTMSEFWAVITAYRPGKKRTRESIEKEKWIEYFRSLLGGELEGGSNRKTEGVEKRDGQERMGSSQTRIIVKEVERTLGRIKNGKITGKDGVLIEFIKYLPRILIREVIIILNEIYKEEGIIEAWRTTRIFQICKKGNEEDVKNYRGVSLLNSGYKLYATILENMLRSLLQKKSRIVRQVLEKREGRESTFSR